MEINNYALYCYHNHIEKINSFNLNTELLSIQPQWDNTVRTERTTKKS